MRDFRVGVVLGRQAVWIVDPDASHRGVEVGLINNFPDSSAFILLDGINDEAERTGLPARAEAKGGGVERHRSLVIRQIKAERPAGRCRVSEKLPLNPKRDEWLRDSPSGQTQTLAGGVVKILAVVDCRGIASAKYVIRFLPGELPPICGNSLARNEKKTACSGIDLGPAHPLRFSEGWIKDLVISRPLTGDRNVVSHPPMSERRNDQPLSLDSLNGHQFQAILVREPFQVRHRKARP